jgi:hypothetical protein
MQFASYQAAAAFARRYALRLNASARVIRQGVYWRVQPAEPSGVLYDPELDAAQRAEGRSRYLSEIAETIAHCHALRRPPAH